MIVKVTKDIDAVEAKLFWGLSLVKMGFAAIAISVVLICLLAFHLPPLVSAVPGGIILFLGFYRKHGMSAATLVRRMVSTLFAKPEYFREAIAQSRCKKRKEMEKAAKAWNRELARQKKRHPNMETVAAIRCERSAKSRK